MTARGGMGDPDALRDEIRQTRADLGRTMQALAAKADVKSRVREQAAQQKAQLREQAMHKREQVMHKRDELRDQGRQRMALARMRLMEITRGARGSAQRARGMARQHPRPFAGVAVGALATAVVVRAIRRRRR